MILYVTNNEFSFELFWMLCSLDAGTHVERGAGVPRSRQDFNGSVYTRGDSSSSDTIEHVDPSMPTLWRVLSSQGHSSHSEVLAHPGQSQQEHMNISLALSGHNMY